MTTNVKNAEKNYDFNIIYMKLNTALVMSVITLILGLIFSKSYIFLPASIVIASIIDLLTRQWVMSDRLGSMINLSAVIKFFLSLIGFYAMIGQFICVGLLIKWFIF